MPRWAILSLAVAALTATVDVALWAGDSTPASAQSTLPAVTGLAVDVATATSLSMSWNAVSGATGYDIQWKETSAASYPSANAGSVTATTATVPGSLGTLTAGTEYTVRVRAKNASVTGAWTEAIALPSSLVPKLEVSGRSITARWTMPAGYHNCEHGVSEDGTDRSTTTCTTPHTHTDLKAGVSHTFYISVTSQDGSLPEISAKATAQTTNDKVTNLAVTGVSGALDLRWDALTRKLLDTDPISYIIQWKTAGQAFSTARQATATTNSHTIPNLTVGTEYTVRVRGTQTARPTSLGPWSDEATGTPVSPEISGLYWTPAGATSVKVEWPSVSGAASYTAHWKTRNAADATYSNRGVTVVAPSGSGLGVATLTGLTANADFTIRVEALGTDNVATASSVIDVSTGVTVSSNADGTALTLNWGTPGGATGTFNRYGIRWKGAGESYLDWPGGWGDNARGSFVLIADPTFTLPKSGVSSQVALTNRRRYMIQLWAFNNVGAPQHKMEFSASPLAGVPDLSAASATKTSLKVDWGAHAGIGTVGAYYVQWKSGDQGYVTTRSAQLASTARTHTITGLTTGTDYTVRVEAWTTTESEGNTVLNSLLARGETTGVPTDKPGYTLSTETLTIAEGSSDTFTIKLKKKPTHDVRLLPTDRGSRYTAKPTAGGDWLTFTPNNWNTAQSVTVTAVEDLIPWRSEDKVRVKWVVRTADQAYVKINFPQPVVVTINDNDSRGVKVDLDPDMAGDQLSRVVTGGECIEYRIKLTAQPWSLMRINVQGSSNLSYLPPSDLPGYSGNLITFNQYNWDTWKPVRVCIDPTDTATAAKIYNKVLDNVYNDRAQYTGASAPELSLTINPGSENPRVVVGSSAPEPPPNVPPVFDSGLDTSLSVAENSPAGTAVGAPVAATDPDEGDTLVYSLSGDDAASFAIDATGQISTVARVVYDYERRSYLPEPAYALTVNVNDGNGGTASVSVSVTLTDVDDSPAQNVAPVFHEGTSATREVAENSPAGTNVGRPVTAFDANGDTLSYIGFDGADGAFFDLDPDTGQITTKAGVTYSRSSYALMVIVMETDTADFFMTGIGVTITFEDSVPDTAPTVADTSKLKTHYATEGELFSLVLPAADAGSGNGGPYAYKLLNRGDGTAFAANGLSFDASTRTLSGTPTAEETHLLTYEIQDGDDNRAETDSFTDKTSLKIVVVSSGNAVGEYQQQQAPDTDGPPAEPDPSPPTAEAGADFTAKRGETGIALNGSGTAHAEGSQTLAYKWTVSSASHSELVTVAAGFLTGADQATAGFAMPKKRDMTKANRSELNDGGWIVFTLTVTDGDGDTATDTVKLTIQGTTWKSIG